MNCLSLLACLVIAQATPVNAPSQREVNGFFLGQYKPVLTAHFGKPYEIRKTDEGWEQRIYILNRSQGSYMIFEFVPAAPDTIYAIQITGPRGTTMFPFAGLKLGDPRTRVDAVLGAPAETKELGDVPGYIAYYEGRNYSVEFQPDNTLSSIRIVGYVGFNADPTAVEPDLTQFKQAIFRRELDVLLDLLMPDVEIFFGSQSITRFKRPARRELNDPTSPMYKALFGSTKSVAAALKFEASEPELNVRVHERGVVDWVYKYPKSKTVEEIVFKFHAGKWRVWEVQLRDTKKQEHFANGIENNGKHDSPEHCRPLMGCVSSSRDTFGR